MTENEIVTLKKLVDNLSSYEEQVDDNGEFILQYISLESALANIYQANWHPDFGKPKYDDLYKGQGSLQQELQPDPRHRRAAPVK